MAGGQVEVEREPWATLGPCLGAMEEGMAGKVGAKVVGMVVREEVVVETAVEAAVPHQEGMAVAQVAPLAEVGREAGEVEGQGLGLADTEAGMAAAAALAAAWVEAWGPCRVGRGEAERGRGWQPRRPCTR